MPEVDTESGTTSLVEYAAATATGGRRTVNEDSFGIFPDRNVFVVADGCGGVASGRPAANLAVDCFSNIADGDGTLSDPLARAVVLANTTVLDRATQNRHQRGMGAALCGLRLEPSQATIVHVGDCRVARLFDHLEWLTKDHTLAAALRSSGASAEQIREVEELHPTVLTRAIGTREDLQVDIQTHEVDAGEHILLCSDGLSRNVEESVICKVALDRSLTLPQRCQRLLDAAESVGGYDNTTVVLLYLKRC